MNRCNLILDVLDRDVSQSLSSSTCALLTHFLSDFSVKNCNDNQISSSDAITLKDLWFLKENPTLSSYNLIIGNQEDIGSELKSIQSSCTILDLSSPIHGRSISGLQTIAKIHSNVSILCCTSPSCNNSCAVGTMVTAMKSDLLAGCNLTAGLLNTSQVMCKAVAISVTICEPYTSNVTSLTQNNIVELTACGALHTELRGPLVDGNVASGLPPIIIICSPYCSIHRDIIKPLQQTGGDLSRVVFAHNTISNSSINYWSAFISEFPCHLCIDCFGYGATFSPRDGYMFPNDDEMVSCVVELCKRGYSNRLILSISIYCKIQLASYGGYGYSYLERVIKPKLLLEGLTSTVVQQLCNNNVIELLQWRQPIKEVVKEVETFNCHICNKKFPITADHYNKYSFVYCSSKCLAIHRQAEFKK